MTRSSGPSATPGRGSRYTSSPTCPGSSARRAWPRLARNARIREEGTANLVAAATAAGARRLVAQSIAFAYAPGPRPYAEDAPLELSAFAAVGKLEELVLGCGLEGVVLRYGRFYGPRTWHAAPSGEAPLHVEAAADAARRAATRGRPGIYNVAEEDGAVSCARARGELGWSAGFRAAGR